MGLGEKKWGRLGFRQVDCASGNAGAGRGKYATYKAYDPRMDEQLPVFILQGYEVIGPAAPLDIKVGPPGRIQHRPSGASSREGRPILSDPGVD